MRALLVVVVLVGCSAPRPGVKYGEVDDKSDPVLKNLALMVNAYQPIDRPLQIMVYVSDPDEDGLGAPKTAEQCALGIEGYRVLLDGVAIGTLGDSLPSQGNMISGVRWGQGECQPAAFGWTAPEGYVAKPSTTVAIEHDGRTAVATIDDLTTPRVERLSVSSVRPGERVVITLTPGEWTRTMPHNASVHLYEPNDVSLDVKAKIDLPRIAFTLPDVRAGRLQINLGELGLESHGVVRACKGVLECETTSHIDKLPMSFTVLAK